MPQSMAAYWTPITDSSSLHLHRECLVTGILTLHPSGKVTRLTNLPPMSLPFENLVLFMPGGLFS